jgi:hypothetical protein
MKISPLCIVFLSLTIGASAAETPEGFMSLFNGRDLKGWHGNNPHTTAKTLAKSKEAKLTEEDVIAAQQTAFEAHWSVDQGELVNDGHGPYANTDQDFGDIEFLLEYKTVAKADSGIYLRGTPQVQIWDTTEVGGKRGFPRHAERGSGGLHNNGTNSPGKWPSAHADQPFGQWNKFHITQIGSRTTVIMNDRKVVDNAIMENYWDKDRLTPLWAKGPIMLQTHGGEIRWRNIYARTIDADEANRRLRGDDRKQGFKPIFNGKDLAGWAGATKGYEVRDGAIVCRKGAGGVLFTEQQYADFVVRLEFRLPAGGNNGLAIRYPGQGRPSLDGMTELQVLDNSADKYGKLDRRQYHGSAYGMVPASRGYLRPVGLWNYQETTVRGSKIKVELNGSVILDADLSAIDDFMGDKAHPGKDIAKGHFGFAGHKDPVMFRNLSIKEL